MAEACFCLFMCFLTGTLCYAAGYSKGYEKGLDNREWVKEVFKKRIEEELYGRQEE